MPTLHYTPAAARVLARLEKGRHADARRLRRVRRALERLAVDPRHPGLCSHRYSCLPGYEHTTTWTSYVDQGAGAWRLHWTWGPTDTTPTAHAQSEPDNTVVVTVLRVGPHL
ncbi:hypothetical protein ABTY61_22600 [Kitasatospora sp. NPDC096128]|uniref:hypothetical protein n=1 Tax=Kitasatospora sp. NPDC096128 TaxID=3155547 RepID=UPI003323AD11